MPSDVPDPRHISHGLPIPSDLYADQPYVVRTHDGAWLCVMTTGSGREGEAGQYIITLRSTDRGRTWIDRAEPEPPGGPEASWGVLLVAPKGRVFCFYVHNTDDVRAVKGDFEDGLCRRVDSLGYYVFKYSDDHGRTWSRNRYTIPVREFRIDRENPYNGDIRFFWNVGCAFSIADTAYVPMHKVGGFGAGFFTRSEGALCVSDDLFSVSDPADATWLTLPDGEEGIRAPEGAGPIAEEHSFSVLGDGSLVTSYRTISGYPASALSRDHGHSWSMPDFMRFADGRRMKQPRAANFVWPLGDGRHLYWFHNHGGPHVRAMQESGDARYPYENRNPAWLSAGVERRTDAGPVVAWSEPEIVLYDDDPRIRMSYPDLIICGDELYVTETQKDTARVHRLERRIVDALFSQFDPPNNPTAVPILNAGPADLSSGLIPMPELPAFSMRNTQTTDYSSLDLRAGFTIDLTLTRLPSDPGLALLDTRDEIGTGVFAATDARGHIELSLSDGQSTSVWRGYDGLLISADPSQRAAPVRLTFVVDGGPRLIVAVVNGRAADGGEARQFGWQRLSPALGSANGAREARVDAALVASISIWDRALLVSEVVNMHRLDGHRPDLLSTQADG